MSWGTLTSDDIQAHLNAGELADYRAQVVGAGDPLTTIIADVVQLVRGYVAARYEPEATGIPSELRTAAIDLVIYRLCKRVRKAGDGDEDRREAADRAMEILKDLGAGRFSLPSTAEPEADPRVGSWGSQTRFDSPPGATA